MICKKCRDQEHIECRGCDCQHRDGERESGAGLELTPGLRQLACQYACSRAGGLVAEAMAIGCGAGVPLEDIIRTAVEIFIEREREAGRNPLANAELLGLAS